MLSFNSSLALFNVPPSLEEISHTLQKFKKEVNFWISIHLTDKDIREKLKKILPESLSSQEIVDIIFEQCGQKNLLPILNAFLTIYPEFELSAYHTILKEIVEDKEHHLNNDSILSKIHQTGLDHSTFEGCCEMAYRFNHPYIFAESKDIQADHYTLNFLWINRHPQDRTQDVAQHIFKDGTNSYENADCLEYPNQLHQMEQNESSLQGEELEKWKNIKKTFGYRISKWADLNPNTQLNLWYDSALVTQKAQQKTFEKMQAICTARGVSFSLMDGRQIPLKPETKVSLHAAVPVYYRVDAWKVLITNYMLNSFKTKCCVTSDIDIEPMTPQQLFDQRTENYLSKAGYVFNKTGHLNFENSFSIFCNNEKAIKFHEQLIEKAAEEITELRKFPKDDNLYHLLNSQSIYNLYRSFFLPKMNDKENNHPRKIVICPQSQFSQKSNSKNVDLCARFRFVGSSTTPYVQFYDQKTNDS